MKAAPEILDSVAQPVDIATFTLVGGVDRYDYVRPSTMPSEVVDAKR